MQSSACKSAWALTFEAYEWCADPRIESSLFAEPLRLWMSSVGEVCLATSCCAAQLSPHGPERLRPEHYRCVKCGQVVANYKPGQVATGDQKLGSAGLVTVLQSWLTALGGPVAALHAKPIAEGLQAGFEQLKPCYTEPGSVAEEKAAWVELARVATVLRYGG